MRRVRRTHRPADDPAAQLLARSLAEKAEAKLARQRESAAAWNERAIGLAVAAGRVAEEELARTRREREPECGRCRQLRLFNLREVLGRISRERAGLEEPCTLSGDIAAATSDGERVPPTPPSPGDSSGVSRPSAATPDPGA